MKAISETAHHEAGHAVIAAVLGILRNNSIITITPDGKGEQGSVSFPGQALVHGTPWRLRCSAPHTRKHVLTNYAGPAVTLKINPDTDLRQEGGGYESDMIVAEYLMSFYAAPSTQKRTWEKAVALVELYWPSIQAVAAELLKRRTITGAEVKATLRASSTKPI
jgi:hypothetical protein